MLVLGGWAITNIATGAIGWSNTTGTEKYFYQMNFMWNLVNLGIAGYSLNTWENINPWKFNQQQIMERHIKFENIYLINTGLDVVYAGTGFLLRHLSESSQKRPDLLMGYGNSIILQGGFLFLFDGLMYVIQRNHKARFIKNLDLTIVPNGAGIHLTHSF